MYGRFQQAIMGKIWGLLKRRVGKEHCFYRHTSFRIGSFDDDADEMIGNVWALSTSNHGEDLGPINSE